MSVFQRQLELHCQDLLLQGPIEVLRRVIHVMCLFCFTAQQWLDSLPHIYSTAILAE